MKQTEQNLLLQKLKAMNEVNTKQTTFCFFTKTRFYLCSNFPTYLSRHPDDIKKQNKRLFVGWGRVKTQHEQNTFKLDWG